MKYFFVLGTNQALSIAELSAVFPEEIKTAKLLSNEILILDIKKLDPIKFIKKIGGTIKIGQIKKEVNFNEIANESINLIDKIKKEGKFKYGISFYGKNNFKTFKLGLEIKNHLREQKINCRFVTSKEKTLSSVVVEQNKLIAKGIEIVLIENKNKILIAQTLAVQPFKELSYRDYGRPARDDKSGMLPPKLAQIMINLSGHANQNKTLLDPFCGSGTILTEAMLMGYKNLIGADISSRAVEDTEKNIKWIEANYKPQTTNYKLFQISADELSKKIKPNSISAIITEPYLGPQRGKHDVPKTIKELKKIYNASLKEFKKILSDEAKIVMVWPVFRNKKYFDIVSPDINGYNIINVIPENLRKASNLKITDRNTIIYGRADQKVWREIILLKIIN